MGFGFFKKLLVLSMVSCIAQVGFSQKGGSVSESRYGVRAGVNLGSMAGLTDISANFKPGYSVGLVLCYRASKLLSSSQELLISNKGFTATTPQGRLEYSLTYLDIPWTVNLNITSALSAYAGLQGSLLLDYNVNQSGLADASWAPSGLSKIDAAGVAGIDYTLPNRMFFGLRFTRGLYSAFSSTEYRYNNYSFLLSAGYYFYRQKGNVFE